MLQAVLSSSLNSLSINTFFCIFGVLLKCSFGFFVVIYFLIFSFNFVVILSCLNMAKICDTVLRSHKWTGYLEQSNSCGYTRLLPKVTLWVITLGWDRFWFPVRLSPPVTLQIITQGQLLTQQYLAGHLIHHMEN